MKPIIVFCLTIFFAGLIAPITASGLLCENTNSSDSCLVNDECIAATLLTLQENDSPFLCVVGCTHDATPDPGTGTCGTEEFPTVWYKVITPTAATLLNIWLNSEQMIKPIITLYRSDTDCVALTPVSLNTNFLYCGLGSNGSAEALGVPIFENTLYYIAVTSGDGVTGEFDLCLSTISKASVCTIESSITITSRSDGGPLEGPFNPGETIGICMNVLSYSAASNGCQWFQGVVPTFGNGWSPESFNQDLQPKNATLNGQPFDGGQNGLYGTSVWDWFTDVDYHYESQHLQVVDFDSNGTVDLCHTKYEPDCPYSGGLQGSCCNPCWDGPRGTILPGGWFSYGINGSCAAPGPPIRVDWGDGNSCGNGMGPWSFCFELKVRDVIDVATTPSHGNLSLSFVTFSDGEIGAWTGAASICVLDQPSYLSLPLVTQPIALLGTDELTIVCEGSEINYQIFEDGVENWEWLVEPTGITDETIFDGPNGYEIQTNLQTDLSGPVQVRYTFYGEKTGSDSLYVKYVTFDVVPQIAIDLPSNVGICQNDTNVIVIQPSSLSGGTGNYIYAWTEPGSTSPVHTLYPPHQNGSLGLVVTDEAGCIGSDIMAIRIKHCLNDTIRPTDDENNDPPTPQDPPVIDGNFNEEPPILFRDDNGLDDLHPGALKVFPVPTNDRVVIAVNPSTIQAGDKIVISDLDGRLYKTFEAGEFSGGRIYFSTSQMHAGVYLVTLYSDRQFNTVKMVKIE